MSKKRAKKYEPKVTLKEGVELDDLLNAALKPVDHEKKNTANRKRAMGKKK